MSERIEIFIIDDHPIYIDGLKDAIYRGFVKEYFVSKWAYSIKDARQKIKESSAEVILLDLKLPGIGGVDFCAELKKNYPDKKVIALTGETDNTTLFHTWMNGADAIVMKYSGITDLMDAIGKVLNGERVIGKDVPLVFDMFELSKEKDKPFITNRERQVLLLLMEGHRRRKVAEKLNISKDTVDTYCKRMFLKFKVNNLQSLFKAIKQHRILE